MSKQRLRKFWVAFLPLDGVFCTLVFFYFFIFFSIWGEWSCVRSLEMPLVLNSLYSVSSAAHRDWTNWVPEPV